MNNLINIGYEPVGTHPICSYSHKSSTRRTDADKTIRIINKNVQLLLLYNMKQHQLHIMQLKQELAIIELEHKTRDGFIRGLRGEIDQLKHDLAQAKTEEWRAKIHATEAAEEEEELRAYLDHIREKIPKLRKKIEKVHKHASELFSEAKITVAARNDYLRNLEKLKRFRVKCNSLQEGGYYEEHGEIIHTPKQTTQQRNLINKNTDGPLIKESNDSSLRPGEVITQTCNNITKKVPQRSFIFHTHLDGNK